MRKWIPVVACLASMPSAMAQTAPGRFEERQQMPAAAAVADEVLVKFTSVPLGTSVWVSQGRLCEATPCRKRLPPGNHEVRFVLPIYSPWARRVAVSDGAEVRAELVSNEAFVVVRSTTSPPTNAYAVRSRTKAWTKPNRSDLVPRGMCAGRQRAGLTSAAVARRARASSTARRRRWASSPKDVIAKVIKRHENEIKDCYESELQVSPDLSGKVIVAWAIDGSGAVQDAQVSESTMGNPTVESCILLRVSRWKFPEPEGGGRVTVSFPWVFKPAGSGDE